MTEPESNDVSQLHAAYRLGRDRFTLQIWQELAWMWKRDDQLVDDGFALSLEDFLGWLDQLGGAVDPFVKIDVKRWGEIVLQKWSAFYASEQHDIDGGISSMDLPADFLPFQDPFRQDVLNLQQLLERHGLFVTGPTDLVKWFDVGSMMGRCEYLVWVGSSVADEALNLLANRIDKRLRDQPCTI